MLAGLEPMNCRDVLRDRFAELPQLEQAGVGIGKAVALGRRAQLRQQWISLAKKVKVWMRDVLLGHAQSWIGRDQKAHGNP